MTGQYTSYFHERIELEFESDYQEENSGKLYLANEKLVLEKRRNCQKREGWCYCLLIGLKKIESGIVGRTRTKTPSYGNTCVEKKKMAGIW